MNIESKIQKLEPLFLNRPPEEKIKQLLQMGRALPPYPEALKIPPLRVPGCQSILYLASHLDNEKLFFMAHSDALISAGLAALLIAIYSGEAPKTILTASPQFLVTWQILPSLTPSRSLGLAHIHQRMKQDATLYLNRQK